MQYKAKQKLNYGEEKHALEQEEQANSTLKLDWFLDTKELLPNALFTTPIPRHLKSRFFLKKF